MFAKLNREMVAELKWVNGNNEGTAMLSELMFSIKRMEKNTRSNEEGRMAGDALPAH